MVIIFINVVDDFEQIVYDHNHIQSFDFMYAIYLSSEISKQVHRHL